FFSSRRRHTRFSRDWSSDVCSSDLLPCRCSTGGCCTSGTIPLPTQIGGERHGGQSGVTPTLRHFQQFRDDGTRVGAHPMRIHNRSEERRVGKEWRSRG